MAYEELFDNPERVKKAVMLYEGADLSNDPDPYYHQEHAYETMNLLMMVGKEGERVRICIEERKPTGHNIRNWEKTLEVMTDIFTAQCAYSREQYRRGVLMESYTERGDRGVNFEMMNGMEHTFAFTSTSKIQATRSFVCNKLDPHLLQIHCNADKIPYLDYEDFLGKDYSHPGQRELLLPPMVKTRTEFIKKIDWEGVEGVSFYDVWLEGFGMDLAFEDEEKLMERLKKNAMRASRGLDDIVRLRDKSWVLSNDRHEYWRWKKDFRQLVLQRMMKIYEQYYGE